MTRDDVPSLYRIRQIPGKRWGLFRWVSANGAGFYAYTGWDFGSWAEAMADVSARLARKRQLTLSESRASNSPNAVSLGENER